LNSKIYSLLSERGIIIPQGINKVREQLPLILEDAENDLTVLSREMFAEQYESLKVLDKEIKEQDRRISRLCNSNELSKRFLEVPGIGPMTASIVASDIGDGRNYQSSRETMPLA
jgi:transposase